MSYLQAALKIAAMEQKAEPETKRILVEQKTLPMTEARRKSLLAVMEALWTKEFQGIMSEVMGGQAKLSDFKESTEAWARICVTESNTQAAAGPEDARHD